MNGRRSRAESRDAITIEVTPEVLDGIWATLAPARKAALINKLAEV